MNAPTIVVTRTKSGGMEFWCPHCKCKHFHGNGGPGHYQAHCWRDNSPYEKTGYILAFAPMTAVRTHDCALEEPA